MATHSAPVAVEAMAPANLDIVKTLYRCFAEGDIETFFSLLDEKVEWVPAAGLPHARTCHGVDEILAFQREFSQDWESWAIVPHEFVASGGKVVALGAYEALAFATGKEVVVPFAHVFTLRGGKVARFQQFTDTALVRDALEA